MGSEMCIRDRLVGAEESGLEVQNPSGGWIPIEAKSKSIVCNIGDMMQLVTRSKLKSTNHRVIIIILVGLHQDTVCLSLFIPLLK